MKLVAESRIDGEFEGFDRDRVFELTNGQRWQQAVHGYRYHFLYRPVARIWSDGASHYLEIEGVEGKVLVRRV